jgi:phosphoglycolate phosphatase
MGDAVIRLGDNEIHAVLFDLDGTLVRTHIDFGRMHSQIRAMSQEAGVPADRTDCKDVLEAIDAAAAWVGGKSGIDLRKSMRDALERIEIEGCSEPTLIPGADRLFARLREASVGIGVVTRNCRPTSTRLLDRFGLEVDVLLTRDDVVKTKPNPAHLMGALDKLGAQALNSVMVGDHWLDVLAAENAGCAATIGVFARRDPSWYADHPPTYIVADLNEVLDLFS